MMNLKNILSFLLITLSLSCATDLDDNPVSNTDINDFIYRGLRTYYLYNENVPDLVNDKTASSDYQSYLSQSSPEDFFESLIFDRQNVDRFSWLTNDYLALEQQFQGLSTTNGMEFGLIRTTPSGDDIFGFVKYVLPNTSASSQGVTRGMLFTAINNTNLTVSNFRTLLSNDTYSINLATYNATTDQVEPNGQTITLNKQVYNENPVFISNTFNVDTETVGYLMYNRFLSEYDDALNQVFASFVAEGINQLVLDLRYNPGGSVNSAIHLGSMISGNSTSDVFLKQQWNAKIQANFTTEDVTRYFKQTLSNGNAINSLGLNKVYILAQNTSASASELVINALDPYLEVIHIGNNTRGKNEFSITLYDNPDCAFLPPNSNCNGAINPNHTWAMQPIVGINENANGFSDYTNGLIPDIILDEDLSNLGVLGQQDEPLLARAIQHLTGNGRIGNTAIHTIEILDYSNSHKPTGTNMYLETDLLPNF